MEEVELQVKKPSKEEVKAETPSDDETNLIKEIKLDKEEETKIPEFCEALLCKGDLFYAKRISSSIYLILTLHKEDRTSYVDVWYISEEEDKSSFKKKRTLRLQLDSEKEDKHLTCCNTDDGVKIVYFQ